jgi:hypothetical protein
MGSPPLALPVLIGTKFAEASFLRAVRGFHNANAQKCLHASAGRAVEPSSPPQIMSRCERINLVGLPPCWLAPDDGFGIMGAAQRARLGKAQVMSV